MSDLISRKAAIDAISSMFAPTPKQKDMIEDCLEIIENLPSAQRWIPVSERLPEASVDVLVCNDDQKQAVAIMQTQDFYGYPMKEWNIKYCLYDCDVWDEDENGKIVAWMPLPEPWEGEENDSD